MITTVKAWNGSGSLLKQRSFKTNLEENKAICDFMGETLPQKITITNSTFVYDRNQRGLWRVTY